MTATALKFGIPELDLAKAGGGVVNPSNFAGHQLIVVFCPTDPGAAARELDEFSRHGSELCGDDAWIIGICNNTTGAAAAENSLCFPVAVDQENSAWSSFQTLLKPQERQEREPGSVFLFGRGGGLQRTWTGGGHAREVMQELKQRA
jgi:peroxiredoxin